MSGQGNPENITATPQQLTAIMQAMLQAQENLAVQARPCTYKTFIDCKPVNYDSESGAIGLVHWLEKTESVFARCNYLEADKDKFATGLLEVHALTWWNLQVLELGHENANAMP